MKQSNTTFSFISRLIIKLLELNQKLCLVLISMKKVNFVIQSLRPYQWIKNGFVFLPLIFAKELFDIRSFFTILQATLIFCLLTGAVYLINDISDLESDRNHPRKRYRPLAAGDISVKLAAVVAVVLLLISLLSGYMIGVPFLCILIFYFIFQLGYTFYLKNVVILDVFCISASFLLRILAGAAAIGVSVSNWLIICASLLTIFLALGKRRHEIELLGEDQAHNHRNVLSGYSTYLLDQMILIVTGGAILSYMLYCISPETVEKFQTDHLIYTFPFVLYGIFRYLYLIHKKNRGGSPEKVLVSDLPLLTSVILWGIFCILIIYKVL